MTHCPALIFSSSNVLSCFSLYLTPMSICEWQPLVFAWWKNTEQMTDFQNCNHFPQSVGYYHVILSLGSAVCGNVQTAALQILATQYYRPIFACHKYQNQHTLFWMFYFWFVIFQLLFHDLISICSFYRRFAIPVIFDKKLYGSTVNYPALSSNSRGQNSFVMFCVYLKYEHKPMSRILKSAWKFTIS